MSVRRLSKIRLSFMGGFMNSSKTDRILAGNRIVQNDCVSAEIYEFDIFSQHNASMVEYNHGKRVRMKPCLNRLVEKVARRIRKIRKRQQKVEGW